MGNVQGRARLSAVALSPRSRTEDVLELVGARPCLLASKIRSLRGSIFHHAAWTGNVGLLEGLIQLAVATTPTLAAARALIVQLVNQEYDLRTTPLMLSCSQGHTDAARILLQHGADPLAADQRGANNALHFAAVAGCPVLIRTVIETTATFPQLSSTAAAAQAQAQPREEAPPTAAAAPAVQPREEAPPAAAPTPGSAALAALLPSLGAGPASAPGVATAPQAQQQPLGGAGAALVDRVDIFGCTALHRAVCYKRGAAVQALLQAGASLTVRSKHARWAGPCFLKPGSTPLHAAVRTADVNLVRALLVAHQQRYGGTAGGRVADPRRLRDTARALPWHTAQRMQLPPEVCALLDPQVPLREALAGGEGPAQQQQADLQSLQELAAAQLRQYLTAQVAALAAAAGVLGAPQQDLQTAAAGVGAPALAAPWQGGDRQQQQQREDEEEEGQGWVEEQGQPSCLDKELQAAARELLLLLTNHPMLCLRLAQQQHLCLQRQHAQRPVPEAAGCCKQQAAAAGRPGAVVHHVGQLDAATVLDIIRLHILCRGVCDPSQPAGCVFAGGCTPCSPVWPAGGAGGSGPAGGGCSLAGGAGGCGEGGPAGSCSLACGTSLSKSSCDSGRSGDVWYPACSRASCWDELEVQWGEGLAGSQLQGCCGKAATGSSSSSGQGCGISSQGCGISEGGASCVVSIMSEEGCRSVPGGCAVLEGSKLVHLLQHMQSSCVQQWQRQLRNGAVDAGCGVCLEDQPELLLKLQPCQHTLCSTCVQLLVELISIKPALCPMCRAAIGGVAVYVPPASG